MNDINTPPTGEGAPAPQPTIPAAPEGAPAPQPAAPVETTPQNVPPVRNNLPDNKDAVIKRLQDKIKAQEATPAAPPAPNADGTTPPPAPQGMTKEQITEIAQSVLQESLGGRMKQLDSIAEGQADQEVDAFILKNPVYAEHAETIKNYFKHPSRAQVPLENIAYEVFGAAAMKAAQQQAAEEEVNANTPASGFPLPQSGVAPKKNWAGSTREELEAEKNRLLQS